MKSYRLGGREKGRGSGTHPAEALEAFGFEFVVEVFRRAYLGARHDSSVTGKLQMLLVQGEKDTMISRLGGYRYRY